MVLGQTGLLGAAAKTTAETPETGPVTIPPHCLEDKTVHQHLRKRKQQDSVMVTIVVQVWKIN